MGKRLHWGNSFQRKDLVLAVSLIKVTTSTPEDSVLTLQVFMELGVSDWKVCKKNHCRKQPAACLLSWLSLCSEVGNAPALCSSGLC